MGTSRKTIKNFVENNKYNIEHFDATNSRPMGEKIFARTNIKRYGTVKKYLLEGQLLENKCGASSCNITDNWLGKPITLELHHIDGDSYNNEISNLMLLCPMCHSQTTNYKGKKR